MTAYRLEKKSGATVTFEPKGAVVEVVTRWPDGDAVAARVPVARARKMWAAEVKYGAKVVTEPEPEPGPYAGCEDPEYHDGEDCDCAEKRAAGWTYCNEYTPGGGGWRRFMPEP